MKSDMELLQGLRNSINDELHTTTTCFQQPNDDVIEFENGQYIGVYDIDLYRNEYRSAETDLSFEEYLLEEAVLYVEGLRDLPQ